MLEVPSPILGMFLRFVETATVRSTFAETLLHHGKSSELREDHDDGRIDYVE